MSDYDRVAKALEEGADPSMLCMTCPWDRYCVKPPTMTSEEVKSKLEEARTKDREEAESNPEGSEKPKAPIGTLITALVMGGKDKTAEICPVLAMRLRSPEGRGVVDTLKAHMQTISE